MNRRQSREHRSNRRAARASVAGIMLGILGVALAHGQSRAPASPPGNLVATVAGRPIERAAYDQAAEAILRQARGTGIEPQNPTVEKLLRRQALEQLVRNQLLVLEAKRQKVQVSPAEVEFEFRTHPFFNVNGRFDSARFASVKAANSPEYRSSFERIREDLAARKLDARTRSQFAPDPEPIRRRVERKRTRADLEYFALRTADFDGDYAEPKEAEVLAYYQTHRKNFSRRERAELDVITVPTTNDGTRLQSLAVADSLILAMRGGASFDVAAAAYGGARRGRIVVRGALPVDWTVTPAAEQAMFRATPGTVLPEALSAPDGWLVIRVHAVAPAGPAPLADVALEIRRILRDQARKVQTEAPLRQRYEQRSSMLRQPAFRVRYARFDAQAMPEVRPSNADLDRYYRSHLADFSVYDERSGAIRTRELDEVRDQVAVGWRNERRVLDARAAAEKLQEVWQRGRRDHRLEQKAVLLRDPDPAPIGAPVDTGTVGRVLGDTLAARSGALGAGIAPWAGGAVVFHVHERIPDWIPPFENYRSTLEEEVAREQAERDEAAARAVFEQDPMRFAEGDVIHFTEMIVPFPDMLDVPLTRQEVERHHLEHIENYAAPEEVRVRHILISPKGSGPEAEAAARRDAEGLLARIRAGEDFQTIARRYSEDPATQEKGGDVGFFGRGRMLPEFERVSFSLKPGEISEVVRTQVGYHIIQLADHIPLSAEPLEHVYPNVGADAAALKGERMTQERADSLRRVLRTPSQAEAAAKRQGHEIWRRRVHTGEIDGMPTRLQPYFRAIAALKPGQILGETRQLKGHGIAFAWLDSIAPENQPEWQQVRPRAIQLWQAQRTAHRLDAKRAELDSMEAAGWRTDSLAALWGGFERVTDIAPGRGLPTMGAAAVVDSLAFGGGSPPLALGVTSGWVDLGRAVGRLRVTERRPPSPEFVQEQLERERRLELERRLYAWYDRLKGDFAVRIVDRELAAITLPQPPPPD